MPAKSDLTGQRFGKLLVVREAERVGRIRMWHVCCACGAEEVHPQRKLTEKAHRVESCAACRTIPCQICGSPVPVSRGLRRYCSDECLTAAQREISAASQRKARSNPDKRARINATARAKRADPISGDEIRAAERTYRSQRKRDQNFREKDQENKRRWYEKVREQRAKQRQATARTAAAEDQEALRSRQRGYGEAAYMRRKALDMANPERLKERNEQARQRRRERALAEFMAEARTILDGE